MDEAWYSFGDMAAGSNIVVNAGQLDILNTLSTAGSSVLGLARSLSDFQVSRWNAQDQRATAQLDRDVARTVATANAEIEKTLAQARLRQVQALANNTGTAGFDQLMANMYGSVANLGRSNNLMLWLTVAGVAIAAYQLVRR